MKTTFLTILAGLIMMDTATAGFFSGWATVPAVTVTPAKKQHVITNVSPLARQNEARAKVSYQKQKRVASR